MNSRNWRRPLIVFLSLFVLILLTTAVMVAQPLANMVKTVVSVPEFQVAKGTSGIDIFEIEGYHPAALPGDPLLPAQLLEIALPPDVIPSSVQVTVADVTEVDLPGEYNIAPAPPYVTTVDGKVVQDWGANAATIVDGKNTAVYDRDAFFPSQKAKLSAFSQMRKFRFARVLVMPLSFNPASGQARFASEIVLDIQFERQSLQTAGKARVQLELSDTLLDGRAWEMFSNASQAQAWYAADTSVKSQTTASKPGYVIVTTNKIVNRSRKLADFVDHKNALGFNVRLITENDYGNLSGQAPDGTVEKIREWLKLNYLPLNIQYVLLIGNPDPDEPDMSDYVGDIPMKIVYPGSEAGDLNDRAATDYLYADLTGNWDMNGDLYYGDVPDRIPGGVDFNAELFVGRIPVYRSVSGWRAALDSILQKTIDYETAPNTSWRQSALLAMTFPWETNDQAHLAERMKANFFQDLGFSTYTMYEQGARGPHYDSIYESNEPLVWPAVRLNWQENAYGLVVWSTHGWSRGASLVIDSSEAQYLNDSRPAFTFQSACLNGEPEDPQNLGYALLKNGAVGTVSASRVSWDYIYYVEPTPLSGSNTAHSYNYTERLANNWPAGDATYTTRAQVANFEWFANRVVYNLYGDPSLRLGYQEKPIGEPIFVSPTRENSVDGIDYARGDILSVDDAGSWAMVFDATEQGVPSAANMHAFTFLDDGSALLVFDRGVKLPGLTGWAKPWDIVRFTPQQPGDLSSGAFSWYFDGSDVGLSASGEKIDALAYWNDRLYISTRGGFAVTQGAAKLRGADEDILEFLPESLTEETAGSWNLKLDGSTVPGLAAEDISSLSIESLDEDSFSIHFSTNSAFKIIGISGSRKDIAHLFACDSGLCAETDGRWPDLGFGKNFDGLAIAGEE